MTGKYVVDYDRIPEETRAWLQENNVYWHSSPIVCFTRPGHEKVVFMPYSIEYLINTPLGQIKEGQERHISEGGGGIYGMV